MQDMEFNALLVQTKHYRPVLPVDFVPRPQLTEWLDARIKRPVTLVSAPAGYGKSTLISSWLDHCNYPHTWLTLDAEDNDLTGFLTYFLEAIRVIFPEAGKNTQALLNASSQTPVKELAISLINDINQLDQFFVLVLDDFEVIQNHRIHDFLHEFLLHPPPGFHLVLCTRVDPLLPIQKLRAKSQLTEIRAQDLRFSSEESYVFLQKMLGNSIDLATAKTMDEQSEGWVTGLRLAALASRHRVGKRQIELSPTVNNRYVLDYLMSEILDNQEEIFLEALLRTSILARFNAELCKAVCVGKSGVDGEFFLEWLLASNLFVIPLDDQNYWVRYHNLFREFLQNKLMQRYDRAEISTLHIRASKWFARNGMIDEALHHALEAGDFSMAAQLVEQNGRKLLNDDKWYTLENWLARLPDEIIQQRPKLLVAKAWIFYYRFALDEIPPPLESIEKITLDDGSMQPWLGDIDFFWGQYWYWLGKTSRSLDSLSSAIEKIPIEDHAGRGEAELFWSLAHQASGQVEKAIRHLNQWLYYGQAPHPIRSVRLLGGLIFIYILSGELTMANQYGRPFLEAAVKHENIYATAWGCYLLGIIHYCWDNLEIANEYFSQAVKNRYVLHTRSAIDALAGLTLTNQYLGQSDKAKASMKLFLDFADETNDIAYKMVAHSCQARVSLWQGDLISAKRWISLADLNTDMGIMFYFLEIPRLTECRVRIAQATPASLAEATQKLQSYEQRNICEHNTFQLIEILLLQAVAYQKQSQTDQALAALARALTLAEPGGWIRPFVELGNNIFELLTKLVDQKGTSKYFSKLLAAFDLEQSANTPEPTQPESQLVESLTNRELEILELLGKRLTNKEIAAELHITVGTVQQHLNHIYSKLNVKRRRQAINKAIELSLIPID